MSDTNKTELLQSLISDLEGEKKKPGDAIDIFKADLKSCYMYNQGISLAQERIKKLIK